MYGINNRAEFLTARNNEAFENQELCVQTEWPHIVGRIRKFGPTESQEVLRQAWTEKKGEDAPIVQSQTHRVYVELVGSLQDVRRDKVEQAMGMPIEQYVRKTLERMAEYVVSLMNEKQQYGYRWDHKIVDDKYFVRLRKAKKEGLL